MSYQKTELPTRREQLGSHSFFVVWTSILDFPFGFQLRLFMLFVMTETRYIFSSFSLKFYICLIFVIIGSICAVKEILYGVKPGIIFTTDQHTTNVTNIKEFVIKTKYFNCEL